MDPVERLPNDISIAIFRHLSIHELAECMLVSRRWYYALDGWAVLWKNIDMGFHHVGVQKTNADGSEREETTVKMQLLQDQHLKVLARRAGPALARIALFFAPLLSDDGLQTLAVFGCTNIRHLEVRASNRISNAVLGALIPKIGAHLEVVALSTTDIADYAVQSLWLSSPRLRQLDLSHCRYITCDAFPVVGAAGIRFCHEAAADQQRRTLPGLQSLTLRCCPQIDDRSVRRITAAFGGTLQHIDVSLTRTTVLGLGALAMGQRAKTELRDVGMRDIDFGMAAGARREAGLEGRSLLMFATGVPQLARLALCGENDTVTDEFVAALARQCAGLQVLDIHDSLRVGDDGLRALAQQCSGLRDLNVSGCMECTTSGVIELVRGCVDLEELDLSGLRIEDAALSAIGDHLRRLSRLSLDLCWRITQAGIRAVVEGSNGLGCVFTLTELSFVQCSRVDESVVDWCRQRLKPEAIIRCRFGDV
ncbi:RNI-like protein [Linderina pennispora]|uniref:RNI-like protein n=1 Tax=Linderina pennispora TaxID=61395 RepID=A0A1Y1W471_9FUNG|nr:RNI-like protein [Linderina pennispora]ORX68267.1 RNI-like protein [Linderina pennispora]